MNIENNPDLAGEIIKGNYTEVETANLLARPRIYQDISMECEPTIIHESDNMVKISTLDKVKESNSVNQPVVETANYQPEKVLIDSPQYVSEPNNSRKRRGKNISSLMKKFRYK